MKILVIDDNQIHRMSALECFAEHDLEVVDSFDRAMERIINGGFDIVLTDMLMPMSKAQLAPQYYKPGELVPYGFLIALKAALHGVKNVAMLTDTNHHHHAMSSALDSIASSCYRSGEKNRFVINGAKVFFAHAGSRWVKGSGVCGDCQGTCKDVPCEWFTEESVHPGSCGRCMGRGITSSCRTCYGSGCAKQGKDWAKVLEGLLAWNGSIQLHES